MKLLPAILLVLAPRQDAKTVFKFVPDNEKQPNPKKTLEDAAKTIVDRLKAAGFEGVTTAVDGDAKILSVTIPKDVAGDDRQIVYALGTRPGVLELRMEKLLGLIEKTEYKDPKAPKGCRWFRINQNAPRGPRGGGEGSRLLIEKPEPYVRKDFGTIAAGAGGTLAWAPTEGAAKKIGELAKGHDREALCFCMDNEIIGWVALDKNWKPEDLKGLTTSNHDPKSAPLCAIILNGPPLPAALRAKD